jgi:hypothetical protein
MRAAKQIVFRYNGDPTTEETISTWTVTNLLPSQGPSLTAEESWKVAQVSMETRAEEPFAVPIYRVFLNEL